jgi:radical SAM PhpK family P-methyltransferase
MTDCLIIGFNDVNFEEYVNMVKSMGTDSGAYRDLNLAYVEHDGKPHHSMELLNRFYFEKKPGAYKPFHNGDFLWPVVTYLSTYLFRRGFSFDYVNLFQAEKDKLREKLVNDEILTIAITTTLYVSPEPILEIISFIKQYNVRARIIVGGPYVSNQVKMDSPSDLQHFFQYMGADIYVINSEGEAALAQVIQALKENSDLGKIDNIAYREGGRFVVTNATTESNSLEDDMVIYKLFPRDEFGGFVTTRTAKSCPFSCSFCGFPQRAGKYTYLGVDSVERELNAIRDAGTVSTLTFIDDTFNVPKKRFKELLRMMIKNRYGFKWNSYLRSDHTDEEAIELMKESGCEGVFLGVESGSDEMLLRMNKTSRRADYLTVIPQLREAGIASYASLIVGFPGETYETVRETVSFIEEAKPDFFRAQLWYCDPTTPIWEKREEYGVKGSGFSWSHDTMDVKTACDLIDKIFLSVENSVWLPQNGFEMWSVYYLQRKQMTLDQIKNFLRLFNAAVKEKLLHPGQHEVSPQLLDSLRTSSRFDEPLEPDMRPAEVLSGSGYTAAEQFWLQEFGDSPRTAAVDGDCAKSGSGAARWTAADCPGAASALGGGLAGPQSDVRSLTLAAFSVLLSRLNGQEDTSLVVAEREDGEGRVAPLRLYPLWETKFSQFVEEVQLKVEQAMQHRLFAFNLLTNPLRMGEHGRSCPVFDVGYIFSDSPQPHDEGGLETFLNSYPTVHEGVGIILKVVRDGIDIDVRLFYDQNRFEPPYVEKLNACLASILSQVSKNLDVTLGELTLDMESERHYVAVEIDTSTEFSF